MTVRDSTQSPPRKTPENAIIKVCSPTGLHYAANVYCKPKTCFNSSFFGHPCSHEQEFCCVLLSYFNIFVTVFSFSPSPLI